MRGHCVLYFDVQNQQKQQQHRQRRPTPFETKLLWNDDEFQSIRRMFFCVDSPKSESLLALWRLSVALSLSQRASNGRPLCRCLGEVLWIEISTAVEMRNPIILRSILFDIPSNIRRPTDTHSLDSTYLLHQLTALTAYANVKSIYENRICHCVADCLWSWQRRSEAACWVDPVELKLAIMFLPPPEEGVVAPPIEKHFFQTTKTNSKIFSFFAGNKEKQIRKEQNQTDWTEWKREV